MKVVVVASRNPVKIESAANGFKRMFPEEQFSFQPVSVPSNVSDQPKSSDETFAGATCRAENARQIHPQADYWIGIEGGVEETGDDMIAFAWVVIISPRGTGKARSGTFFLPPPVVQLIRQGKELGEADDIVFNRSNSKQENGAIGILTGDVINRTILYEIAVILALVTFKNPDLYLQP